MTKKNFVVRKQALAIVPSFLKREFETILIQLSQLSGVAISARQAV
jgi:hypothetical protein